MQNVERTYHFLQNRHNIISRGFPTLPNTNKVPIVHNLNTSVIQYTMYSLQQGKRPILRSIKGNITNVWPMLRWWQSALSMKWSVTSLVMKTRVLHSRTNLTLVHIIVCQGQIACWVVWWVEHPLYLFFIFLPRIEIIYNLKSGPYFLYQESKDNPSTI